MLYKHCLCSVLWCFLLSRGIHPSGSFSSNKSRVMFFVTCIFVESLGFNSQDALSYRAVILGGNFPAGAEVYASTWEAFPSIAVIQHNCDQCSHKRPCWCPVSVILMPTICDSCCHRLLWEEEFFAVVTMTSDSELRARDIESLIVNLSPCNPTTKKEKREIVQIWSY